MEAKKTVGGEQIPVIPVGSNSPAVYQKWAQIYLVRLRVLYEKHEAGTDGAMTFDRWCRWVFRNQRNLTEPCLN